MTCVAQAALAAVVLLSLASAPARADDSLTCNSVQGQAAIDACTRLIESGNPGAEDRPALFFNDRGYVYDELGQHARAIKDYDEAIRLEPDNETAFGLRGNAYRKMGQYARAVQDFDEAIRLQTPDYEPDYASVYYERSLAEGAMGKTTAADADLAKARSIDPDVGQ